MRQWQIATFIGIILLLTLGTLLLIWGRVNVDEGWYLYAGRLAYQGHRPIQDFAYTQMPLLPYIWGLSQIVLGPGIFFGRLTSFSIALVGYMIAVLIAYRHRGWVAAGTTALLLASFTFGLYLQIIPKTYSTTSLLFLLCFLILSTEWAEEWKLPLATLCAILAIEIRLSAIAFALPIILYALRRAHYGRIRVLILIICGIGILFTALFILPDVSAAYWHLIRHHIVKPGNYTLASSLLETVVERIPSIGRGFGPYLFFFGVLAFLSLRRPVIRDYLRQHDYILVVSLGAILFGMAHLNQMVINLQFLEYFVPSFVILFPIAGILFAQIYTLPDTHRFTRLLLLVWLLAILITEPVRSLPLSLDITDQQSVAKITEVSKVVEQYTASDEPILTLEALWVAVESGREVLPGLNMALFSYYPVDTDTAVSLHVVNHDILLKYMVEASAGVVVLTESDWEKLDQEDLAEPFREAISAHYKLIYTGRNFGQSLGNVYVYIRQNPD